MATLRQDDDDSSLGAEAEEGSNEQSEANSDVANNDDGQPLVLFVMASVADMKAKISRMQREMDCRLLRIETLERKVVHMQREIDERAQRRSASSRGEDDAASKARAAADRAIARARAAAGYSLPPLLPPNAIPDAATAVAVAASATNTAGATAGLASSPPAVCPLAASPRTDGPKMMRNLEEEMIEIVEKRRKSGTWPIKAKRADKFAADSELRRLRVFNSAYLRHNPLLIEKTKELSTGQKRCALCSEGRGYGNKSRYMCGLCSVPLCKRKKEGFKMSCYDAWHAADDLMEERMMRCAAVEEYYMERKNKRLKKNEEDDGEDDDNGNEDEAEA
mmetsp:Transcript_36278/g.77364  ORF Transcript_36278/g.77364 Transcript_36278/m.77364 type:complete len:335 (+) Transcript_36278:119-1123(+)